MPNGIQPVDSSGRYDYISLRCRVHDAAMLSATTEGQIKIQVCSETTTVATTWNCGNLFSPETSAEDFLAGVDKRIDSAIAYLRDALKTIEQEHPDAEDQTSG